VALLGQWMPPVVDRAIGELVCGVEPQLPPAALGFDREPDLGILELVAEPVGAALLGVAAAPPEPRRDRLVSDPVVDERVERGLRRLDAMGGETLFPAGTRARERGVDRLEPAEAIQEARRLAGVPGLASAKPMRRVAPEARSIGTRRAPMGSSWRPKRDAQAASPSAAGSGRSPKRPRNAALSPSAPSTASVAANAPTKGKLVFQCPKAFEGTSHMWLRANGASARRARSRGRAWRTRGAAGRHAAAPLEESARRQPPRAAGDVREPTSHSRRSPPRRRGSSATRSRGGAPRTRCS
jgi:hypothetical protein